MIGFDPCLALSAASAALWDPQPTVPGRSRLRVRRTCLRTALRQHFPQSCEACAKGLLQLADYAAIPRGDLPFARRRSSVTTHGGSVAWVSVLEPVALRPRS